jgi:toxin ParE1/3/4
MARYEVASHADRDLDDIYAYSVATFGEKRADDYLLSLRDCFLRLAEMPGIARKIDHVRLGYFQFEHASHVIFFIRIPGGIRIMRVLHQRMDIKRHI